MPQSHDQVCPWCQTEIVWDPEIGPEETCPHCFNELGDYRSINLKVGQDEQEVDLDEEEADDPEDDEDLEDYEDYEEFEGIEDYEEGVQRVLDTQEDTPECPVCHSFMLLTGTHTMPQGFVPVIPPRLNQPLVKAAHSTKVFVCPSCFRVEQVLSEEDRLAMIELLKQHGHQ
ncbi:hypothetical protein [Paenibacillus sp. OAS669]|uniref:hypothetical protein n=1 Tax=Paenibacillus sp. OAS669 TaxID=2663821 RepID=UPI00178B9E15|nr:hypothetical protein [Paenibacillus sp. OAS669]MBE1441570.1 hypothetical protein [Paenibacillus sp. OAS669]